MFRQNPLDLGNLLFRHADTLGDSRTSHGANSLLAEHDLDQSLVLGRCQQRPDRLVASLGGLGLKIRSRGQLPLGLGKLLRVPRLLGPLHMQHGIAERHADLPDFSDASGPVFGVQDHLTLLGRDLQLLADGRHEH